MTRATKARKKSGAIDRRLEKQAEAGRLTRELLARAAQRPVGKPPLAEILDRILSRTPVKSRISSARIIREARGR